MFYFLILKQSHDVFLLTKMETEVFYLYINMSPCSRYVLITLTYRVTIIIIIFFSDCITPQGVYSQLNKLFTDAASRTD